MRGCHLRHPRVVLEDARDQVLGAAVHPLEQQRGVRVQQLRLHEDVVVALCALFLIDEQKREDTTQCCHQLREIWHAVKNPSLWKPALLITLTLVLTGIVIGLWSSRLLGIDPVVSLLGAAPGGISGMSLVGAEFGVGAAVATLHAVRLITVLLVLPLLVKLLAPLGLIDS